MLHQFNEFLFFFLYLANKDEMASLFKKGKKQAPGTSEARSSVAQTTGQPSQAEDAPPPSVSDKRLDDLRKLMVQFATGKANEWGMIEEALFNMKLEEGCLSPPHQALASLLEFETTSGTKLSGVNYVLERKPMLCRPLDQLVQLHRIFEELTTARTQQLIQKAREKFADMMRLVREDDLPEGMEQYFHSFSPCLDDIRNTDGGKRVTLIVRNVHLAWILVSFDYQERLRKIVVPDTKAEPVKLAPEPLPRDATPAVKELYEMIGLGEIKRQVRAIIARQVVTKRQGVDPDPVGHFVFSGNPGTGKTTVARHLAQILLEVGAMPEKLDAEEPRKQPDQPSNPKDPNYETQLAEYSALLRKGGLKKTPMTQTEVALVEQNIAQLRSKKPKTQAVSGLRDLLAEIQDKHSPEKPRHKLERDIKAAIRETDPDAIGKQDVSFVDLTGAQMIRLGPDKLEAKLEEACPGVVFVDEAYQLNQSGGQPIRDLLMQWMDPKNKPEMVFVWAGYRREIDDLVKSNPGFRRRLSHYLNFTDYTRDELFNIFLQYVSKIGGKGGTKTFSVENANTANALVNRVCEKRRSAGFGNAGDIEKAVRRSWDRQRLRLDRKWDREYVLTEEDCLGPLDLTNVDKVFQNLGENTGIPLVKLEFLNLAEKMLKKRETERQGKGTAPLTLHRPMLGGPGTGKTTCARLYAQLLLELGMVTSQDFIETSPSDLKGSAVGEAAQNVNEVLARADQGVLFIDEAYGLSDTKDPYIKEIVATLLTKVEGKSSDRVVVLMAGYEREMHEMFRVANPGLKSRMQYPERAFVFQDYTEKELLIGAKRALIANDDVGLDAIRYPASPQVFYHKDGIVGQLLKKSQELHFGNMREVQNLCRSVGQALQQRWERRWEREGNAVKPHLVMDDVRAACDVGEGAEHVAALERADQFPSIVKYRDALRQRMERDTRRGTRSKIVDLCFRFQGPPGTGKTTAAASLAAVLKAEGVLFRGHLVSKSVSELQTGYTGQAGLTTRSILDEALGGVLFIDEAYRLMTDLHQYGKEIVNELVNCVTEPKYRGKVAVVVGGYESQMQQLMTMNEGLSSRFKHRIAFDEWDTGRCCDYFLNDLMPKEGFQLAPGTARRDVEAIFDGLRSDLTPFSSARTVESLFEECMYSNEDEWTHAVTLSAAAQRLVTSARGADISSPLPPTAGAQQGQVPLGDAFAQHMQSFFAAQGGGASAAASASQAPPVAPVTRKATKQSTKSKQKANSSSDGSDDDNDGPMESKASAPDDDALEALVVRLAKEEADDMATINAAQVNARENAARFDELKAKEVAEALSTRKAEADRLLAEVQELLAKRREVEEELRRQAEAAAKAALEREAERKRELKRLQDAADERAAAQLRLEAQQREVQRQAQEAREAEDRRKLQEAARQRERELADARAEATKREEARKSEANVQRALARRMPNGCNWTPWTKVSGGWWCSAGTCFIPESDAESLL